MLPVLTIATLSAPACAIGTIDERHFYKVGLHAIAIVAITVLAGGWYLGFRVVGRQAKSFRSRPWRFVGLAASALLALGFSSAIALAVFAILFSG
jgi:hypothetical protein